LFRFNLCASEPLPRRVSPSRQFIIYGGDARFRGAISALAEKTKSNLLTVLKCRDNWKIAIVVNLQSRAANLPEIPDANVRFSQSETGLKLQLDFAISPNLNPATIEHELARAILLEMIYRNQTGITFGDVYVDTPRWLVDGLLELAPNRDHTSISTVVALPDRVISLEAFLLQSPESLDSSAKEFYRAYSFVLVQMLIESPNGRSRIKRYVDNLAIASNDPLSDLLAAFPALRDFERSWRSKIAEVRSSGKGLLTFSQTEERLNRLLGNFARFD